MKVLLLTLEQKDQLVGEQFANDSYFNPIQDLDNNWVISTQERDYNQNLNFIWIADLPAIDYVPKEIQVS